MSPFLENILLLALCVVGVSFNVGKTETMIRFTFLNILFIVVLCAFFNCSKIHAIGPMIKLPITQQRVSLHLMQQLLFPSRQFEYLVHKSLRGSKHTSPKKISTTKKKASFEPAGSKRLLAANRDYCSLCKNHIACNNNGGFGRNCPRDRAIVRMTSDQRKYILQLHNQWRNKIALGNIHGYKSARRMPVMEWSSELAYLAELNVRSCKYGHDGCRATVAFPYAGQNIAYRGNTWDYEETKDTIENIMKSWFTECKDADMSYINAYRSHDRGKKLGHFTVMANERNNRVGCALNRYQADGYKINYFVCNYGYTNMRNEAVYTPGKAASRCVTGKHPIYRGLCSTKEQIKPFPGRKNH